jgi:5-methylcytosine-specific restriction endonuclease McrA
MPISRDYPAVLKARKRRDKALPLLIIDLEADSPLLATLRTALHEADPKLCRWYMDVYIPALRDEPWRSFSEGPHQRRLAEAVMRAALRGAAPRERLETLRAARQIRTFEDWHAICAFYQHRCLRCGQQGSLVVDHVLPLSKGGGNSLGNVQPLCARCNAVKGDRIADYRPHNI